MAVKKVNVGGMQYSAFVKELVGLFEQARHYAAIAVNSILTATYWETGRRIVEFEQHGRKRAEYGEELLAKLSQDLTKQFGRGFSRQNLQQMRQFYFIFPTETICQTLSGKSEYKHDTIKKSESPIRKFSLQELSGAFPLSWSHYVRLITVKDQGARDFYETEALRGGWTVRQLARQIDSRFYERTVLSKNKAAMLKRGSRTKAEDIVTPEEEIRDPYILEFLGLKDEYSENDLEEALIYHLEHFLLELGNDFAFVGRQKRLRIGDEWFRVDLLFFHRRLRCLVIIDLKIGRFTHADAGQMHMYLNYAREHWTQIDENPPTGLILCAQKNSAVAKYSLEGLPNKVLVSEYRLQLPDEKIFADEINKARKAIEQRTGVKNK